MAQISALHQPAATLEIFSKEGPQQKEVKRHRSFAQQATNGSSKKTRNQHLPATPSPAGVLQQTEPFNIQAPRAQACPELGSEQLDRRTPVRPTGSSAAESWDARGNFDTTGGVLRLLDRDEKCRIVIPPGAIAPDEGVIAVRGKVSWDADLPENVRECLKDRLAAGDFLASPVVRCVALREGKPGFTFRSPVHVVFPHLLSCCPVRGLVRIYQVNFNGQNRLFVEELRLLNNAQDDAQRGTFYFGRDNQVIAVVDHFSYFCLVSTCEGACPPEALDLDLYAARQTSREGSCDVRVRLEIKNSRLDFEANFQKNRGDNFAEMVKKDYRRMAALRSQCLTPGNAVLLKLILSQPGDDEVWQHCTDSQGKVAFPTAQRVPMERFQACKCKWFTVPEIVEWELTRKVPSFSLASAFRCYVTAAYVSDDVTADAATEVKMSLTIPDSSAGAPVLPTRSPSTDGTATVSGRPVQAAGEGDQPVSTLTSVSQRPQ